jgi:hypothetical protein
MCLAARIWLVRATFWGALFGLKGCGGMFWMNPPSFLANLLALAPRESGEREVQRERDREREREVY